MTKDEMKRVQYRNIGPGGLHCACCVMFPKKHKNHKRMYRRHSRRVMKHELRTKIQGGELLN